MQFPGKCRSFNLRCRNSYRYETIYRRPNGGRRKNGRFPRQQLCPNDGNCRARPGRGDHGSLSGGERQRAGAGWPWQQRWRRTGGRTLPGGSWGQCCLLLVQASATRPKTKILPKIQQMGLFAVEAGFDQRFRVLRTRLRSPISSSMGCWARASPAPLVVSWLS